MGIDGLGLEGIGEFGSSGSANSLIVFRNFFCFSSTLVMYSRLILLRLLIRMVWGSWGERVLFLGF